MKENYSYLSGYQHKQTIEWQHRKRDEKKGKKDTKLATILKSDQFIIHYFIVKSQQ